MDSALGEEAPRHSDSRPFAESRIHGSQLRVFLIFPTASNIRTTHKSSQVYIIITGIYNNHHRYIYSSQADRQFVIIT
jgi:hypothetical protein